MSRVFIRSTELGLLIVAAIAFAATLASFELSQGATLSVQFLYYVGGFIGVFAVAHIALTIWAPYADQVMLPVVSLLNGLGLIMVYRIDADGKVLNQGGDYLDPEAAAAGAAAVAAQGQAK